MRSWARKVVRPMRSTSKSPGETGPPAAPAPVDRALLEKWALAYLERYASSAENLRRVLQRRVWRWARANGGAGEVDREAVGVAGALIDALVARYRAAGLIND